MAAMKLRSRMISVRLSEEEYMAFREVCEAAGGRTLSELTRDAVRALLNDAVQGYLLGMDVGEFRDRMRSMGEKIEQMEAELTNFKSRRTTQRT
jgi:hypothetical protein